MPGFDVAAWFGLAAPGNTPPDIVEKLNREVRAALADAKLKSRLADLGSEPLMLTPSGSIL